MPIEPITNQEFLNNIKNGIANRGVFLMAITDKENDADKMTGGFTYTIGHQERGRSDIVALIYDRDHEHVSEDKVLERFFAVSRLINSIVAYWDETPLLSGHTASDDAGIYYKVYNEADFNKSFKDFTIQASNYYGRDDYELLILIPTGFVQ